MIWLLYLSSMFAERSTSGCLKGLYEQIKSPFTKNQLPYYRKLTLHEIKVLESNAT